MPTMMNVNEEPFKPIPGIAGKIKVNCDLFEDSSDEWEACHTSALA